MWLSVTALASAPPCDGPRCQPGGFEKPQIKMEDDSASHRIKPDDSARRTLAGGEAHSQPVDLSAGQYLHVTVAQKALDVTITLLGPRGESLIRVNNNGAMYGSESLSWVAERGGTYLVRIASVNKRAALGAYEVTIDAPRPAEPNDRVRLAAQRHFVRANRYYERGDLHRALNGYAKAKGLWQEVGDRVQEAAAANNIGYVYNDIGDIRRAITQYKEALSISRHINDRFGEATALNSLGWSHSILGENYAALDYQSQALRLTRDIGDRQGEALALKNIGTYYRDLAESQMALDSLTQALSINREIGDTQSEVITLLELGEVYRFLNDSNEALSFLRKALDRSRELNEGRLEVYVLSALGDVYTTLGDTRNALATLEEAVRKNKLSGDQRGLARCLYDIGNLHAAAGRISALAYYQRALSINRKIGDRRGEAKVLSGMSRFFVSSGQRQRAMDALRQALALSRAVSDRQTEASALHLLARLSREQGDLGESLNLIQTALEITDSMRNAIGSRGLRSSYFASIQKYYEFYIDLLMQLHELHPDRGFAGDALVASERARARNLLETLAGVRASARQNTVNGSPREASLLGILTVKEIQEQIVDDDTILLEYALGEERSYLWAVTRDSVTGYKLPPRSQVEASARKVYELLTTRAPSSSGDIAEYRERVDAGDSNYLAEAGKLSRTLLGPVAEKLGTKRLLIASHGALQYIPFEALPSPEASGAGGEPHPLFIDHEIDYLPSASVLAMLRREAVNRKPAPSLIAVLADPVFNEDDSRVTRSSRSSEPSPSVEGGQAISRLPATRWEAEEILASAPAGQGKAALGFDANRETALSGELSKYRIVHFATHGFFNNEQPEQSGIVLSSVDEAGRRQNGFLQLHDIYGLNLSADLIVLSSCETGLGKNINGEGIVGLTHGFLYAGAQGVVTSLWRVDDRATADLMARFYQAMLKDGLTPSAALRAAKMSMWKQGRWRHPYYWAGFVLQGNGDQNVLGPAKGARHGSVLYAVALLPIGIIFIGIGFRRRYNKSNRRLKGQPAYINAIGRRDHPTAGAVFRVGSGE